MPEVEESERGLAVPLGAALTSIFLLGIVVFFGWRYIQDLFLSALLAPAVLEQFAQLMVYAVLVAGVVGTFLFALIIFLLLAGNQRARSIAKRYANAERMSTHWFGTLYDSGPTPYLLIDKAGIVSKPNKATVRLLDKEVEEIEGKAFSSFFPDLYREEVEEALMRFNRGIVVVDREFRIIGKGGRRRWILLSVFTFSGYGKHKGGGLAALVDITERKELERQKSEFLSLTSHQLHTPLVGIRWYTDMLLNGDAGALTDKQREYLATVHRENEQMINLVGLLLNVSRLEMGHLPVKVAEVDLVSVCDSVAEELIFSLRTKNLKFKKDYHEGVPTITSDQRLIRVIIQNLLSNALKYTPNEGEVVLSLKKNNDKVRVSVADTGIGIPKEDQSKVFERAFRATNVIKAGGESSGNGLGLYLIRSLVFILGGDISFASEPDKGTTFVVDLPVKWSQQASEERMLRLHNEAR
jgi:PAS domain S-box-containing protein